MRGRALAAGVLLALIVSGPVGGGSLDLSAWCTNAEAPFSIPYPVGWYVHPADPARDIAACERFGPQPFQLVFDEDDRVWRGESLSVGVDAGCVGSFWAPASTETRSVGGFSATRIEYLPGVGAESPLYPVMTYYARLSASTACDATSRFLYGWTSGGSTPPVGDHEENKAVLDAMMAGLQFAAAPDTAMELPRGWSPWTLIGLVSLVAAGVLGLRRRRAFD
jgi:hypothetical protein